MATSSTSTSNQENEYKMTSNPRGFCLLINNELFKGKSPRKGTAKDKRELKEAFETLGFQTVERDNQAAADMERRLQEMSKEDHSELDCFVCCILSHGNRDVIEGTDGEMVKIDRLKSAVKGDRCRSLRGKPKVFVIQACSGENLEKAKKDSSGIKSPVQILSSEADFLILQSSVPGYASLRYESSGSPFIQILSSYLKNIQERVPRKLKTDSSETPSVKNEIQRIADLKESQTSWCFKARVVFKGEKLPWKKDKKQFRFNVTFEDASGTVKAVAFNENVDLFMKKLEYSKVYKVTGRSTLKREEQHVAIILHANTVIEECNDDEKIPQPSFSFVPFNEIPGHKDNHVDIMGVVISAGSLTSKKSKYDKRKTTHVRNVTLVDWSLKKLTMALWGKEAEQFEGSGNPVIAVKNAKVTTYNGICSVSKPTESQLLKNEGITGAEALRDWYDREGHSKEFTEIWE